MVQILGQGLKLSSCQLLLILLGLYSLYFPILLQFISELFIFLLEISEFLSSHVEVVLDLSDIKASEYFLDEGGLLVVEGETFAVEVFSAFGFVLFAGVVGAEVCLDGDGCCFLS